MATFEELVASRKAWIADVLQPWCRSAARRDLLQAEQEWMDIAGRADTGATLWSWAWSRFPDLVHEGLNGINETQIVTVQLHDGRSCRGYPDGRAAGPGQLVLISDEPDGPAYGPISIDEIQSVESGL